MVEAGLVEASLARRYGEELGTGGAECALGAVSSQAGAGGVALRATPSLLAGRSREYDSVIAGLETTFRTGVIP